jgi:hypothetical protein
VDYKQIARPWRIYNLFMIDWQTRLQAEFQRAEQARANRNEGQARVCARRAAGIAIREYFTRNGTVPPSTSAVDLLTLLKEDPLLSPDLKLIADHLTLRVNEEFKLPVDADLVAEARQLCDALLK